MIDRLARPLLLLIVAITTVVTVLRDLLEGTGFGDLAQYGFAQSSLNDPASMEPSSDKLLRSFLKLACFSGKVSQYATPYGAVNDPIFWPVHSVPEKIFSYFRLANKTFDPSWPYSKTACKGHNVDDLMPFTRIDLLGGLDGF